MRDDGFRFRVRGSHYLCVWNTCGLPPPVNLRPSTRWNGTRHPDGTCYLGMRGIR